MPKVRTYKEALALLGFKETESPNQEEIEKAYRKCIAEIASHTLNFDNINKADYIDAAREILIAALRGQNLEGQKKKEAETDWISKAREELSKIQKRIHAQDQKKEREEEVLNAQKGDKDGTQDIAKDVRKMYQEAEKAAEIVNTQAEFDTINAIDNINLRGAVYKKPTQDKNLTKKDLSIRQEQGKKLFDEILSQASEVHKTAEIVKILYDKACEAFKITNPQKKMKEIKGAASLVKNLKNPLKNEADKILETGKELEELVKNAQESEKKEMRDMHTKVKNDTIEPVSTAYKVAKKNIETIEFIQEATNKFGLHLARRELYLFDYLEKKNVEEAVEGAKEFLLGTKKRIDDINKKTRPYHGDVENKAPLHYIIENACEKPNTGWEALLQEVLQHKYKTSTDINISDKNGVTPMYIAAKHGRADLIKILSEHGADVNKPVLFKSPLYEAAHSDNDEAVASLLDAGALIDEMVIKYAHSYNGKTIEVLLKHASDEVKDQLSEKRKGKKVMNLDEMLERLKEGKNIAATARGDVDKQLTQTFVNPHFGKERAQNK